MPRLFFVLMILCQTASAAEPTPSPLAEAERLVSLLGAEDFDARDAAEAALLKLGDDAVDALRRAVHSADPEIRHRARNLRLKLDPSGLVHDLIACLDAAFPQALQATLELIELDALEIDARNLLLPVTMKADRLGKNAGLVLTILTKTHCEGARIACFEEDMRFVSFGFQSVVLKNLTQLDGYDATLHFSLIPLRLKHNTFDPSDGLVY